MPAKKIAKAITEQRLMAYALWYLQKQFPSSAWLKKKLEQFALRKKPASQTMNDIAPLINKIVTHLTQQDIINDDRLATSLCQQWVARGLPIKKITDKLLQKGFARTTIATITRHYQSQEIDEEKIASDFAERKKLGKFRQKKINPADQQKFFQKDMAKMARAGFSFAAAKKALS